MTGLSTKNQLNDQNKQNQQIQQNQISQQCYLHLWCRFIFCIKWTWWHQKSSLLLYPMIDEVVWIKLCSYEASYKVSLSFLVALWHHLTLPPNIEVSLVVTVRNGLGNDRFMHRKNCECCPLSLFIVR